jgi:hypothetical protein
MSDRALPEGVKRYEPVLRTIPRDLHLPRTAAEMEQRPDGRYFAAADLPKIEAHLATRLLSDEAVERLAERYYGRMPFDQSHRDEEQEASAAMRKARKLAREDLAAISTVIGGEARKRDKWCRECGLRLTPTTPPSVHTGHVHNPIDHWVLDAAATVWAVAKVIADGGDQSGIEALRPRLSALGITEQAMNMFLRQNPPEEAPDAS